MLTNRLGMNGDQASDGVMCRDGTFTRAAGA